MEEAKVLDVAEPLGSEHLKDVFWQWQSGPNPDPWAEKDPVKRTWQDYADDDCHIIEEAFLLKKEIAELKDYEIDLKKMVQVNKKFRNRIRRVRRQEKSHFMMEISKPVPLVKDQKTMNEAFGTIQHFLEYIMKRTPEAYVLYQKLKALTLDSKANEFEEIVKGVIICIEKGAEAKEKIIKTRSGSQTINSLIEAKKVVHAIKMNSTSLRDFLKVILKVYTTESFICYWLNELLRSEDWEEINVLTPYLVCLVYTFKLSEFVMKYQEPQGFMNNLLGFVVKPKLYLFRGAALSKEHLELYNPKKIEYFSWNGVTSTSRDKNIALDFIRASLIKAKRLSESKVGVLFKIETDFASPEDCEGMIDTLQHSCSQYPDELEVILAPGTVFKLLKGSSVDNSIYEISLKVHKDFQKTKKDMTFLGILQDQAILRDKAIIEGLPSQQSFILLDMLKGNKLIRKLEIRNSGVEDHIMEEIENLRLTMNVKREDVKMIDNTIVIENLSSFIHYLSLGNVNNIAAFNKIRLKEGLPKDHLKDKDREEKTLVLSEEAFERFQRKNQLKVLYEKIKDASEIMHLNFSMKTIEKSSVEFRDFLRNIKELKHLQSLKIKLNENQSISGNDLEMICQAIGRSSTLKRVYLELTLSNEALMFFEKEFVSTVSVQNLSLDLKFMNRISHEGLKHLMVALLSLPSLQHLSLNFSNCKKLSEEGLQHLKRALISLKSLQYLSLNLARCPRGSYETLSDLKSALISLKSLQHLELNFGYSEKITDKGLNNLKNSLISLTSLQRLSLNFNSCRMISNTGRESLNIALQKLTSLQHLSLYFKSCTILAGGFNNFTTALKSLTSLQHLSLDLGPGFYIFDTGFACLREALKSLTSLQHLSLDFEWYENISDRGLEYLKEALISLISLLHLSLCFSKCKKITNQGLNYLKSALISLTSLQHLSLDFQKCDKISHEGLNYLNSGLRLLTSLQNLDLNFRYCESISDEGINYLSSALISLTSLQHLSLDFQKCYKISNQSLNYLKNAILSLTSLSHVSLDFRNCYEISHQGLNYLRSALVPLTSLQHLSLDFSKDNRIFPNDKTKLLKSGELSLKSLQHLALNFESWIISDEELNHLTSGLISATFLQYLSLNFRYNAVSEKWFKDLQNVLVTLSSLQHLFLGFYGCNQVSDKWLKFFKDSFVSLTSLQHLSLDFSWCQKISDEGLNYLKTGLGELKSLQHLSIDFSWCKEISDNGLNYLGSGLISLKVLQHLELKFEHCDKISDEGLNHLSIALRFLLSLQHIFLNFSECKEISDEGLKHLQNALRELKSLDYLYFSVKSCDRISHLAFSYNSFEDLSYVRCEKL